MSNSIKTAAMIALLVPALAGAAEEAKDAPPAAGGAPAVTPGPTDAAKPTTPAQPEAPKPPPWYGVVSLSGYVDGYYQVRLDAAQDAPLAQRAFDGATGFALGHAVLSADVKAAPAGLHIDLDFGQTAAAVDSVSAAAAGSSGSTFANHVLQAFAVVKLGPVEANVGRFVTLAGAEVVLAKDNWLYSRSLLFNLIPITHTGLRLKLPVTDAITVQAGVNNGWDVVTTTHAGKTGEVQVAYSGPSSTTVGLTAYFGPSPLLWTGAPNRASDWRVLLDAVVGGAVGPLALNLNFDYGSESSKSWWGIAPMARYSLPDDLLRVSARFEYVNDGDGVRFGTGTSTKVWEVTGGLAVPVGGNSELRAEVRFDKSSDGLAIFAPGKDSQVTGTLAALAWF